MIRIYKDTDSKVVTRGAYDTFYKPLGYKPVIEQEVVEKPKKVENKETTVRPSTRVTSSKRDDEKGE